MLLPMQLPQKQQWLYKEHQLPPLLVKMLLQKGLLSHSMLANLLPVPQLLLIQKLPFLLALQVLQLLNLQGIVLQSVLLWLLLSLL